MSAPFGPTVVARGVTLRRCARPSDRGRRERHAEPLTPHNHAAVGLEARRDGDEVVLIADVALEGAEVEEAVVERPAGPIRWGRRQVDAQERPVRRPEALEADVALAVGHADHAGATAGGV